MSAIPEIRPEQSVELLKELHILTRDGKLNQDSRRKLKQVYHLYQFIEPLLAELSADGHAPLLADHGAGKSYLGFILYDLFFKQLGRGEIYGIEWRVELVQRSRELAQRLGFARMHFLDMAVADAAGATADAFTRFEKFEERLKGNKGNLRKAAVELAREWRTDKVLRRLDAMLVAGDSSTILLISGAGDVLEPDDGIIAIGSGGSYALAAARALAANGKMANRALIGEALRIAADICIYTNNNTMIEEV